MLVVKSMDTPKMLVHTNLKEVYHGKRKKECKALRDKYNR